MGLFDFFMKERPKSLTEFATDVLTKGDFSTKKKEVDMVKVVGTAIIGVAGVTSAAEKVTRAGVISQMDEIEKRLKNQ